MTDEKTYPCGRCDYTGTLEQRDEHADEAGHPICATCTRSLYDTEPVICEKCLTHVRDTLTLILDAHAGLHPIVTHSGYRNSALPGGDALVILAGGSVTGGGPDDDMRYHDPIPTVAALLQIAVALDEQGAPPIPAPLLHRPTVAALVGYLQRQLRWAAEHHDDFAEVAAELRGIGSRLAHVSGIADDPVRAPAKCFDCGGQLQRTYRPLLVPVEVRLLDAKGRINNAAARRKHPAPLPKRRAMVRGAVTGKTREGLTDVLTCADCRVEYTWAQYAMALRSRAKEATGWVSVKLAAEVGRLTEKQVRRWVERGVITARCEVLDHRLLVLWDDVHERVEQARDTRGQRRVS